MASFDVIAGSFAKPKSSRLLGSATALGTTREELLETALRMRVLTLKARLGEVEGRLKLLRLEKSKKILRKELAI